MDGGGPKIDLTGHGEILFPILQPQHLMMYIPVYIYLRDYWKKSDGKQKGIHFNMNIILKYADLITSHRAGFEWSKESV